MKKSGIVFFILLAFLISCKQAPEIQKEPWRDKPLQQWPDFALTNAVHFENKQYEDLANSFLINTGADTIAASCKHLFMAFQKEPGLRSIDLGDAFKSWKAYPKNKPGQSVQLKRLINQDKKEPIGQYNTLKNRDWIIFEVEGDTKDLYPLKIRFSPIEKGELVYAIGWGSLQEDISYPVKVSFRCYQHRGNYYYAKTLTQHVKPGGTSGSPVIDRNGYLVGITSGAEGKLAVIGSIEYLVQLFDRYGVDYRLSIGQPFFIHNGLKFSVKHKKSLS